MRVLVIWDFVWALTWLHSQKADDVAHCLCWRGRKQNWKAFRSGSSQWSQLYTEFNLPAYRLEFVQMKGQRSLPSQTRLPLLPTPLQSLAVKPSGCGRPPSPPDPPAKKTEVTNQCCIQQAGNLTSALIPCVWHTTYSSSYPSSSGSPVFGSQSLTKYFIVQLNVHDTGKNGQHFRDFVSYASSF